MLSVASVMIRFACCMRSRSTYSSGDIPNCVLNALKKADLLMQDTLESMSIVIFPVKCSFIYWITGVKR